MYNQYCTYFVVALANDRVPAFWNFVWEHDVLRAFEKIVMVEVSEHVEFCSSTTKNIHYHNSYGHQTWQGGNFSWRGPT